jgi:hypothetical protein
LEKTLSKSNEDLEKPLGEVNAQMGFDDIIFWFLPDSWKCVFHPRALRHWIIADTVLHEMAVERGRLLGVEVSKEIPPVPSPMGKLEL